jgi:hypothetical protein
VFETGAEYPSSPSLSQPDVATDGYTREPTTAQRAHLSSVPGLIAAYWTQAKDTGRSDGAMGPLEPGYWTDQKAVRLAAHRNGAVQSNGLIGKFRYWVDPKDPVFVTTGARASRPAGTGRSTPRASLRRATSSPIRPTVSTST